MRKKDDYRLKKQFTDEEIKTLIENNLARYRIIVKSELVAMESLAKYGLSFNFCHEEFKRKMVLLLEYANKNNIKYKLKEDDLITTEDIIERIKENECKRAENIYKYYMEYMKNIKEDKTLIIKEMQETLNYYANIFDEIISDVDDDYIDDDIIKRYYSLIKKYWLGINKQN